MIQLGIDTDLMFFFQFGGSTVVLLLKRDTAILDDDILENSQNGIETLVKFGEKIGTAK